MTATPMTKARRAWLERLEREGIVTNRGRGSAGVSCMRAGWTEWVWALHGSIIGEADLIERYARPEDRNAILAWCRAHDAGWKRCGERLTRDGRAALADAQAGKPAA